MSNAAVLELRGLSRSFVQGEENLHILKQINFSLKPGQVLGLVGPSGCGKSTLLHIAGLLDAPTSGSVIIAGQDTAHASDAQRSALRGRHIGFIYQFHNLMPDFTALENAAMPLRLQGKANAEREAIELLEQLGVAPRARHLPAELSGGEQQRVAIARALIHRPALLLADEPTGNLDPAHSRQAFELLLREAKSRGMAALIATHNHDLAKQLDECLTLAGGMLTRYS